MVLPLKSIELGHVDALLDPNRKRSRCADLAHNGKKGQKLPRTRR